MVSGVDANSHDLDRLLARTTTSGNELGNSPRVYLPVNVTIGAQGERLSGAVIDILGIDKQNQL